MCEELIVDCPGLLFLLHRGKTHEAAYIQWCASPQAPQFKVIREHRKYELFEKAGISVNSSCKPRNDKHYIRNSTHV